MADDTVVNFRPRSGGPSVPPPPLPSGPQTQAPAAVPPAIEQAVEQSRPVGSWPLAGIAGMRPPRPVPALPAPTDPEPAPSDANDGEFIPPAPADPNAPTAQEILATCLALMTALGVAAAKGMWHRASERKAAADKTRAKTSAHHSDGRTPKGTRGAASSGPSLLRSLGGGGGGKGPRAFGHKNKPHGKDAAHRSPHGGPPKGPKGKGPKGKHGFGHAALKAARKGTKAWKNRDKAKHPKDPKGGTGQAKTGTDKNTPSPKTKPSPKAAGTPGRPLTWKAPKDGAEGSKRWSGRTGTTGKTPKRKKPKSRPSQGTPDFNRPSIAPPKTWKAPKGKAKAKKPKRWRTGAGPWSKTTSPKQPKDGPGRTEENRQRTPPPPPPPGFEGMRPPPAADRTTRITVERVDQPDQSRTEPLALAEGPRALSAPVKTTQYADADLTVHDVIDADKDMAEEILAGVAVTRSTADGCDLLLNKLEGLYAEVLKLKVPGVLAGMVVRLMDKTATVKAKAEAIAAALPAASEAISVAGSNAEIRHKPLADTTRDMGHIQPAERDYHNE